MYSRTLRPELDFVVRTALALLTTALLSACAAQKSTAYSHSRHTYLLHAPGAVAIHCHCTERPAVDRDALDRALCVGMPPAEVAPERQSVILRSTQPSSYSTRRQYCEALNMVAGSRSCVEAAPRDKPEQTAAGACTLDLPAAQLQLDALMCEAVCTAKTSGIRGTAG